MCIIAYNKTGAAYDPEQISCAFRNNHDGVGIMWREDNKVRTYKALLDHDTFLKMIDRFVDVPHVLHLRWATHGGVSKALCHPFVASHDDAKTKVWLMHNGIIDIATKEGESDTSAFARRLRGLSAKYGVDALFHPNFTTKLEEIIQCWNKVVLMADDGRVAILNEDMGFEDEKNQIWYSNTHSLVPKKHFDWVYAREMEEKADVIAEKLA